MRVLFRMVGIITPTFSRACVRELTITRSEAAVHAEKDLLYVQERLVAMVVETRY